MAELRFEKWHGTGNDFVMVEDWDGELDLPADLVAAMCDRHLGVGADGLIRVASPAVADREGLEADGAHAFMDYRNADGSLAEMCGNGVRCLAKVAFEHGLVDATELTVATRGGRKRVWLDVDGGHVRSVRVDMGPPELELDRIPMAGPAGSRFLAEPFEHDGVTYKATAVSMGNPHLVLFVERDPDQVDVHRIGPQLEHDPRFPNRTNVEFVAPAADGIKLRVWERGVGETMACGTGACASLVAAGLTGLAPRTASIHFPGGTLLGEWADDTVYLSGPAERAYVGTFDADELLRVWKATQ
ncbi:MAG TPA: diaminopimelate epimerase [Actinomycetota bacterium]|jgi:diaminopimelate epimerase